MKEVENNELALLEKEKRDTLNAMAVELGLSLDVVKELPNRSEVAKAILVARAEQATAQSDEDEGVDVVVEEDEDVDVVVEEDEDVVVEEDEDEDEDVPARNKYKYIGVHLRVRGKFVGRDSIVELDAHEVAGIPKNLLIPVKAK